MTTVRGTQRRLSHVSPSSMVCSTARADFPAACAARGGARRTDALARLGALVALLAAWFAQRALLASLCSLPRFRSPRFTNSGTAHGRSAPRPAQPQPAGLAAHRPQSPYESGVSRHREVARALRQKIQKTQRIEDPYPPLPPPAQCQKFRLYVLKRFSRMASWWVIPKYIGKWVQRNIVFVVMTQSCL